MMVEESAAELSLRFPATGRVEWIGIRPVRHEPVIVVERVLATLANGLAGDHYAGKAGSARQVTLFQSEHLDVVAKFLGTRDLDPALLRRNLVISGINLVALKGAVFRVGEAVLAGTGACAPCSKMEASLSRFSPGGLNAMRGHGGITARVVEEGWIRRHDPVEFLSRDPGYSGSES